ncbi:hypothetical protein PG990_009474 [Apiospora arundinis]
MAHRAYKELSAYMSDLYTEKKAAVDTGGGEKGMGTGEMKSMDLLGALIRSSTMSQKDPAMVLSQREVLGNAFIFMFGGHETTASTMYYALVFLALHPASQRLLQADLDAQFPAERPIDSWDYDADCAALLATMPGAVIHETLRLIPPLMSLPKTTARGGHSGGQPLEHHGQTVFVPPGTRVNLVIPAAHRNPNYWPGAEEDLHVFRPQRWFLSSPSTAASKMTATPADNSAVPPVPFRPHKGAYLPFSDGRRACIGRRFALVEAVTALAVLLRHHSIELAVGDPSSADDDAVALEAMGTDERAVLWEAAARKARRMMKEGVNTLSFKAMDSVPLRFVDRGREMFYNM